jgi:hypothetical protein
LWLCYLIKLGMKSSTGLCILVSIILLCSCNPKVSTSIVKSYPPLDYKEDVLVIGLDQSVPSGAEVLGQVKIGDTGFSTKCNYNIVLDRAKLEARKAGGNAIKIVTHIPPSSMGSSCHRITANVLKLVNIENYNPNDEEKVIPDVDYAVLNVYRYSGSGSLVGYDLHLGDSVICRVVNNFKTTLHIKKDGLNTLWSKTESKSEVSIDIKVGRTYYLRCGITTGLFVGRPQLQLIDSKIGKMEFENFNAKNK